MRDLATALRGVTTRIAQEYPLHDPRPSGRRSAGALSRA